MVQSENPFIQPSALARRQLQELAKVVERTFDRGWHFGTAGNFSLRGHGGVFWQSPSGFLKKEVPAHAFIPIRYKDLNSPRPCVPAPSAEMPLHAAIYHRVPGARCVLHTHPPYVVSYSMRHDELRFAGQEMAKVFGAVEFYERVTIPMIDNTQDMHSLGNSVGSVILPEVPLLVLKGHGVYAWGSSPQEALNYIEGLDFLCQTNLL